MVTLVKPTSIIPPSSLPILQFQHSESINSIFLVQIAPIFPTRPMPPIPVFKAADRYNNTFKSPKIDYAPKNPVPVGIVLTDAEILTEVKAHNSTFAFYETLKEWLRSPRSRVSTPNLRLLIQNHVKNYEVKNKRTTRRDRGKQREAIAAVSGAPPPRKPKKDKKKNSLKGKQTLHTSKTTNTAQVSENSRSIGYWRIINGIKTYVGPQMPIPQRPTKMPSSTRINPVEAPTKWKVVDGVKIEVNPPTSKPQIKFEPALETFFWRVVNGIKILGR